ncbi:OmpA family protein [Rhodanobacter aciditrophus]|uniref:OmpA family protein n=1 Tax=Rhodanobacter aciditrophus TaxID=1623218 RepID=A0ABW4B0L5_9GAMM
MPLLFPVLIALVWAGMTPAQAESLFGDRITKQQLQDNDEDGVINARDLCPNTPQGARVDNDGCHEVTTKLLSVEMNVLFDSGRFDVKPLYFSEIKKVADFLRSQPNSSVVIEGHTDDVGNDEYNLNLSQNRADAIANVLINNFRIAASRVEAIGYGETRPIASNSTTSGQARNRRVVAEVFANSVRDVERWTIYSVD